VPTNNLTPEQKQFIRHHENDDVRNLALLFSHEKDLPFLRGNLLKPTVLSLIDN
jgi:hypothetical protein